MTLSGQTEKRGGVYRLVNDVTGRVYYGVAKSFAARLRGHRHALRRGTHVNERLQLDYRLYGESAFRFDVLHFISDPTQRVEVETGLIAASYGHDCYNIKPSSGVHTTETCRKIAESKIGKKRSPETIAKMSAAMKGVPRPQLRGRVQGPDERAVRKAAALCRAPITDETRAKMSASAKAHPNCLANIAHARSMATCESHAKISATLKRSWDERRKGV